MILLSRPENLIERFLAMDADCSEIGNYFSDSGLLVGKVIRAGLSILVQGAKMLFLIYAAIGGLVSGWFYISGYRRIDRSSIGARWYTRLLWVPGAVLLWPWVVAKAIRGAQ